MRSSERSRRACLAALCLTAWGCSEELRPRTSATALARQALDQRKIPAAQLILRRLLAAKPQHAEARFLFGESLLAVDDAVSATIEFGRAIDLGMPPQVVVPRLIHAMTRNGRAAEATERFPLPASLEAAPRSDWALALAVAWGHLGRADRVRELTSQAMAEAPDSAEAKRMSARLKVYDGDAAGAWQVSEQLIQEQPALAASWELRGVLLRNWRSDLPAAIEALRRATVLDPYCLPAQMQLMSALYAAGDVAQMRLHGEQMERFLPDSAHEWYALTQVEFLDAKYERARELIQYTVKAAPDNPRFLALSAAIDLQLRDALSAESTLVRIIGLVPTMEWPRQMLAQLHRSGGRATRGLEVMLPILSDPGVSFEYLGFAAELALMVGDVRRADTTFKRAFDLPGGASARRPAWAAAMLGLGLASEDLPPLPAAAARPRAVYESLAQIAASLLESDVRAAHAALQNLRTQIPSDSLPQALGHALERWKRPAVTPFGR